MNVTTFKQRLTSAKRLIREMKAAGQPIELTRGWSSASMKELSKALAGGPETQQHPAKPTGTRGK